MLAPALLKNYRPFKAPLGLTLLDILRALDNGFEVTSKSRGQNAQRRNLRWNHLLVGGMWFQDLFNYDFRRTEMCVIPYATQQGEISFCACNTGVGWRKIIENIHKNATGAEWYNKYGRHKIYAADKHVDLETYEHSLQVNAEDAFREKKRDDCLGTEERKRQRQFAREAAQVRQIYEEMVLGKKKDELIQLR